jgi:hypothetical protein
MYKRRGEQEEAMSWLQILLGLIVGLAGFNFLADYPVPGSGLLLVGGFCVLSAVDQMLVLNRPAAGNGSARRGQIV